MIAKSLVLLAFAFIGCFTAVDGRAEGSHSIDAKVDAAFIQDVLVEASPLVETLAAEGYTVRRLHLEYMDEAAEHLVVEEFPAGAEYVIAAIADPRIDDLHLTAYAPYGDVINTDTEGGRRPQITLRAIADSEATLEFSSIAAAASDEDSQAPIFVLYVIGERR